MAHDQENQESEARPYYTVVERDFGLWKLDLRDERYEGFYEVEEAYYIAIEKSVMLYLRMIVFKNGGIAEARGARGNETYGHS